MKLLSKFLILTIFTTAILSCTDDDDTNIVPPEGEQTIASIVENDSEFSNLFAALEAVGLTGDFDGEQEFTVFAPSNAAFNAFLETNNFASLGEVPLEDLERILLNHVVEGTNLSTDLTTGYINSFGTGNASSQALSLFINTQEGVVVNGVATVNPADVEASNGVIHVVNSVIDLPSIVTHTLANPEFSTLVEALQLAGTDTTNYVQILSSNGESTPFTVFAPTNQAFEDLLSTLGVDSLNEVDPEVLASILEYHVIASNNIRSSDLSTGINAVTLQGESLGFDLSSNPQVVDATDVNANIEISDVQSDNGVVHGIDKVLLPQEVVDIIDPTVSGLAMLNDNLSSLAEALELTGLDQVLANRSAEFTVFAPTNTAFTSFLNGETLADQPLEELRQLLLNHVLSGTNLSGDLETSYTNSLATFGETENKLSLYINAESGVVLNGISSVMTPDNQAANGVVHIVDEVIALPTVVTFATADPEFSNLASALTDPGQADEDFVTQLNTQGTTPAPFTVLAPTNLAFENLLTELGVGSIGEIDPVLLTSVLNTHVISESNLRQVNLIDGPIATNSGEIITVNVADGTLTDPRGRLS
jgi:transforming growth factor-beta-induced protein